MKLHDLIPTKEQISFVQGIESSLLERRRLEVMGGVVALMGGLLQVLITAIQDFEIPDILSAIYGFFLFLGDILSLNFSNLQFYEPVYELAGIAILASGIAIYLVLRYTRFLLRESEEPFSYTFWIDRFKEVQSEEDEKDQRFKNGLLSDFLHLDIIERLNERVGRLSLLDEEKLDNQIKENLNSHIYIDGEYALRRNRDKKLFVHVIARIRIGAPHKPSNLTYPINYPLNDEYISRDTENLQVALQESEYEDIVERVYSGIATEIYSQIKKDLDTKISMFPTKYRRAVALFYEANDFARSNTVDAYNHAIELYREAIRYFNVSMKTKVQNLVLKIPIAWRLSVDFHHKWAQTVIEYAKCLVYRRMLSALSGRSSNTLYEIPDELAQVIRRLNNIHRKMSPLNRRAKKERDSTFSENYSQNNNKGYRYDLTLTHLIFKKDSLRRSFLLKTPQSTFTRQKRTLLDAYITAAMTYFEMDSIQKGREFLKNAKAVDPSFYGDNALADLSAGLLEPDLEEKNILLRHATEKAPNFEIARFLFAKNLEMILRTQHQIDKERARQVLAQYDRVTYINPGNIAALNSQGYIYWLINCPTEAKKKFLRGSEVKSLIQNTFTGELNYGLARIAAQEGNFNRCYEYFEEAISSDPSVGAYSEFNSKKTITPYYSYIGPRMKDCFTRYKEQVEDQLEAFKYSFTESDILDPESMAKLLLNPDEETMLSYLGKRLSPRAIALLQNSDNKKPAKEKAATLAKELTNIITDKDLLRDPRITSLTARKQVKRLIKQWEDDGEKDRYYQWNRTVLEELFPGHIRRHSENGAENGQHRVDAEGKLLSKKTIDVVHSFVLNDYANALQNYFHRFGNQKHLLESIDFYELAKKKNPSYKVVYLNLENAYRWLGNLTEARNCLQEGEKYFSSWETGQRALLQSEVEHIEKKIKELTKSIDEKQSKTSDMSGNMETRMTASLEDKQVTQIPSDFAQKKWEETDAKSVSRKELGKLEKKLEKELNRRVNIFAKLETMMANSNLGTLFEGLNIDYKGDGVERLYKFKEQIEKDKLQEDDIDALHLWAQILSYNDDEAAALKAAKKLCELIKFFSPDHFDATIILHQIFISENEKQDLPFLVHDEELKDIDKFIAKIKNETNSFTHELCELLEKETELQDLLNGTDYRQGKKTRHIKELLVQAINQYFSSEQPINWGEYRTDLLSPRTKKLLKSNLTNRDLMGLKRRIAEDLFPESIAPKKIKGYRKDIRNSIEFWIKQKDKTYASFTWAVDYTIFTFPEFIKWIDFVNVNINSEEEKILNIEAIYDRLAGQYKYWNDWTNVEMAFEKAKEINPGNATYYNELGVIYYQRADYEKAIEYFNSAIDHNPDTSIYFENLGNAHLELRQWKRAKTAYEAALDVEPENAGYINRIGLLYYRQEKYSQAATYFKRAAKRQKDEPLYQENTGDAYGEIGKWEEAEKAYLIARELDEDSSIYDNKIGILYYQQNNYQKALEYFKKAADEDNSYSIYHANCGDAYIGLGQYEEAIEAFTRAIELSPDSPEYFNKAGVAYYRIQDYEKAADCFMKASNLKPGDTLYRDNIGDAYLELGWWDKAYQAYQDAININPISDYTYNKLGILEYRQQKFEKAITYFIKAAELNPGMSVYINNIGDAYNALGNFEKARTYYDQAYEMDHNKPASQNE